METNTRFIVNYNGLGDLALLVVVAGVLLAPGLRAGSRLTVLALVVACALLVVATGGRGSIVGLLGALVVLALSTRGGWLGRLPSWWRLAAGAGLALVGLGLGLSGVLDKGLQTDSLGGRAVFWRDLLAVLGDYAFTGVGLGMQAPLNTIVAHGLTPRWDAMVYAHNLLVQAYLEQGPLGAVALGLLVLVGLAGGALALRRPLSPAQRTAVRLGLAALVGIVLHGLTDQVPTTNYGTLLLLAAAILCVLPFVAPGAPSSRWLRGRWLLGVGVGASVVLAVLVTQPRHWADVPASLGALELAKAATKSGDWQASTATAERWLGVALSWAPDHPPALRHLARLRLLRNDAAGAAWALERATAGGALAPFDAIQVGRLYYQLGFLEEGRRWTRAGLEAGNGLNRHAALQYDRLVLDQDWRVKTLVEQAEDLRNQRQYAQALPLFQQALALAPDNRYLLDQVDEVGRAVAAGR
jgi:O-antigen ligase